MCEFCSNKYHLSNAKWGEGEYGTPGGTVYWSFAETPGTGFVFSDYITDPAYRDAIRDAFQAWEDVADIDFVEVSDGSQTQVRLGWDVMDGPYDVVGEASSRGYKTTETLFSFTEGEIRFDSAENWTTDKDVGRNEVGFFQVALHEIGHILGLNHTTDPDTIMYSSDISDLPGLTEGDIMGAQLFYGAVQNAAPAPDPVPEPTPEPEPEPAPPPVSDPEPDPAPDPIAVPYVATRGNDTFSARSGDDVIDGMGGTDTLTLSGDQSQYTLTLTAGAITLTDRMADRDGNDQLINIEQLAFQSSGASSSNVVFNLDAFDGVAQLSAGEFYQIVELYIAYFNRAPDAVGLAFWGDAFEDGLSLQQMAALFIDQVETRTTYPDSMSDTAFATAVYNNVLGRVPDAEGFAFWVDALSSGAVGRDTFILSVLEGAKAAYPAGASAEFIAQVQQDRAYLSDKVDVGAYFAVHRGMSNVSDAAEVMALFDGSSGSKEDAYDAADAHYADALSTSSGDFLMPLVGVLDLSYETG